jgi:hypothetical protein
VQVNLKDDLFLAKNKNGETAFYTWAVTSVEDSPRPVPGFTAVMEDNTAAVENVIRENRQGCGISIGR